MTPNEGRRVLAAAAAARVGGLPALAAELNLSERIPRQYIEGMDPLPDNLFLKVVDVILKQLPEPPSN